MNKRILRKRIPAELAALSICLLLFGCGGAASVQTVSSQGSSHPSAKTLSDAGALLVAYGQAVAANSFVGYGPRVQTKSKLFFDPVLGLYARVREAPDGIDEILYQDAAATEVAGNMTYVVSDITLSMDGTISVTAGRFSGLTGFYHEVYISTSESNGDINYTLPNVATTVSQFALQTNASGQFYGNATIGVVLQSGYSQTEVATYSPDGSQVVSSTDSNSCASKLSFAVDLSGSGTITGSDPGLPAKVAWSSAGTGVVTFSDGSTAALTGWQLASPPSGSGLRR